MRDVPIDDGKPVELVTQEIYEKAKLAGDDQAQVNLDLILFSKRIWPVRLIY